MFNIKKILLVFASLCFVFISNAYSDETALFTTVKPDALIVLDLSGSMNRNPAGGTNIWGNSSCTGTFYASYSASDPNRNTNCSRLAIAKRAIFDLLDDNNDNVINSSDETSLGIRMGYMRFYDCNSDDTGGSYTSGCNSLIREIGSSSYSLIYSSVNGESARGGTPLASALNEAKLYLDVHKASDSAGACRKKFVVLITDGEDTFACNGNGFENQTDMYKRRKATVARAKKLADAGYKVFVVGFGADMPDSLENTLNWAAYYGGTDNPLAANSGNTNAITPSSNPCNEGSSNDPGSAALSGYAFLAANATDLSTALKQAFNIIREATYSFSVASVSSSRITDENYIYEASFQPVNNDPFWLGHLKKYNINADGTIGSMIWDAGTVLQTTAASSRNIKTYKRGSLIDFNTTNITPADLGVTTPAERDAVVGYIRGEPAYNPDNWKLGDIFHSNPITIGTPSAYFSDAIDTNNAFSTFRSNNQRTSANNRRVIVTGANDGQFHAFRTSDGSEYWSFIPPNLLPKLKNIAHSSHPTGLSHQYFVDGPVSASDVWLGSGSGTTKSASDWKTLVVFSEGRGAGTTLWSSSSSCDSGFNATYSSTYQYYCGYYAFDFTDTISPVYKWRINPTSTNAPYLGEPWSRMAFGRVKISGNEKWVGFIGGGYNTANCAGGGSCDTRGKGFYVVDLSNGNILWSYTRADNTTMAYSIPAHPAIVDTDNDGFIDTAYVGDLGGNMWRFKFCTSRQGSSCSTTNWSGSLLFDARGGGEGSRPVYNSATIAKDASGNLWVYWATGDKTDPTAPSTNEKVLGIKDNDRTTTYTLSNLNNVTSAVQQCNSETDNGWYINFTGREKALSDITIFGGVVYFTTYVPSTSASACDQAGISRLYAINYQNCTGVLSGGARSIDIGVGIASAPIISLKPGGGLPVDLYVTVSGGAGQDASTIRVNFNPPGISNRTNILYWKDRRVQ
ncbi:pilus assembly protein [Dissulfurispira sp.]|uniref:pilus assembly protein n=1 Tax=Dissulfurispira sp. TaxID=2817609 RepID=UPI002FDB5700